jgi:hypothetical protein
MKSANMKLLTTEELAKLPFAVIPYPSTDGESSQNQPTNSQEMKGFITEQQSSDSLPDLPKYKIRKQTDLEISIDNWLGDEANRIIDDAEDGGEIMEYETAFSYAVDYLQSDFDAIDGGSELISDFNKTDNPKEWEAQKLLILKYLKTL